MPTVFAVIMAGGRSERFWPLSTERLTKPFIQLLGPRTLIQETVERLDPLVPPERILVSVGAPHSEIAREQLPEIPAENFVVEPVGRDTSACLAFCALHLERRDPDCAMLAVPADHFIEDTKGYRDTLQRGFDNLKGAAAIVFGIKPLRAETGYGYVQARRPEIETSVWPVVRFVEKPEPRAAESYLKSGDYFWNSGMFLWRNRTLLDLFREHLPETYHGLCELRPLIDRSDRGPELLRIFSSLERISVDYGILQKATGLGMIPVEFGWDDIGNWAALDRALPVDHAGNVSRGPHVAVNSTGCIAYSDAGVVATFGISDIVVVQAHGKVLVCPKDQAAELKRLVSAIVSDDT